MSLSDSPDGDAGQVVSGATCERVGIVFEDRSGTGTDEAANVIADDMAGRLAGAGVAVAEEKSGEPEVEDFLVGPDKMMDQVKTALRNVRMGKHTLQIPNFSTEDSLRSFIRLLNQDTWLRYNAVIVCFSENGCVTFGISRVEDGDFWQSCEGARVLGDRQINIYSVSEFTEIMMAMWSGGIAS